MTEYVVKWKHWRYPAVVDWWLRLEKSNQTSTGKAGRAIAKRSLRPANEWRQGCTLLAQHGGKTECAVYRVTDPTPEQYPTEYPTPDVELVAHAEAVCSWRDQFDRRIGRLYSLALALCELDLSVVDRRRLLLQLGPAWNWNGKFVRLDTAVAEKDKPTVKAVCAEITENWKHPR